MAKQWTRNYDNLFLAAFGLNNSSYKTTDVPTYAQGEIYFRTIEGHYMTPYLNRASAPHSHGALTSSMVIPDITYAGNSTYDNDYYGGAGVAKILLGSGDAEPSYEDYTLDEPKTTGFTTLQRTIKDAYDHDTHTYTRTYKIPLSYSGAEAFTVREFGIYVGVPYQYNSPYVYSYFTLVYRETLDEPITLQQNDTIEITFSQSITNPNYIPYSTEQ